MIKESLHIRNGRWYLFPHLFHAVILNLPYNLQLLVLQLFSIVGMRTCWFCRAKSRVDFACAVRDLTTEQV